MIKALIIDDEKHCIDTLLSMIQKHFSQLQIAAVCYSGAEAIIQIQKVQPQLVFLDVEMDDMTGFEMLETLPAIDFDIIFTTAFNQYAIRAIKFGALDYLVKPIDKDELSIAIDKFISRTYRDPSKQLSALLTHLKKDNTFSLQKIALPALNGYELVPVNDIMFCESKSNYTHIFLQKDKKVIVSRTLKDMEELLNELPFFRTHHSFLVNLHFAIRYIKGDGGQLILTNEMSLPVSRTRKEDLLQLITHFSA